MAIPTPLAGGDAAFQIWEQLAKALATNDSQALHAATQQIESLSTEDRKTIETLLAMMPAPWLSPTLLIQIFSNPETSIGILSRLNGDKGKETANSFGIVESAIILAALTHWMNTTVAQAEQQRTRDQKASDLKKDQAKADADAAAQNPINLALQAFIQSQLTSGVVAQASTPSQVTPSQVSTPSIDSVQFLKNNPILLSGLQTADPALLTQALQVAQAQILIACLDQFIATEKAIAEAQQASLKKKDAATLSPNQQLATDYIADIKEGKVGLTQASAMLLQFLLINAAGVQVIGMTAPAVGQTAAMPPVDAITNTTLIAATQASTQAVGAPANDIVNSWQSSYSNILPQDPTNQIAVSSDLISQLGLMASIYAQMAPYWSIPAAVSLVQTGGVMNEAAKTEAAVRAYAIALGTLISSPEFTQIMKNLILRNVPNPAQISTEQLNAYISGLKISLLLNAFVAIRLTILRKTEGKFSPQELCQMILGKVPLPVGDDVQAGLIRLMQAELSSIPEENWEAFLMSMLGTYSENSNLESMIDPSKQFLNLCDQSLFMNQTASESI